MKLSDVILLEKHKDILKDKSQVIFAEGVTNASKSFILGIKFIRDIIASPKNHTQFVLAGKSLPVLEKMYIQNPSSFYNLFKPICKYIGKGEGGSRIEVETPTGIKTIYLLGYDNATRWSDILGLTISGFNVEEINIANDEFIRELFIRVFRNNGFLICSSNGGDPDTLVYKDYLNKCRPLEKYLHQIPKETMKELERSEASDNFKYYFFNFDDNPSMSEKEKENLYNNTPKGSYVWFTKILGIRGVREGVIYANYMTKEKNIIPFSDVISYFQGKPIKKMNFIKLTIGIDVGGTDHTVFTLNGFTQGFKKHIVIDYIKINNANHDMIWNEFIKWIKFYFDIYGNMIYGAFIDSAAKIMRLTMNARMQKAMNIQCVNAYKYLIKERVDMGITFLDQGRLQFTDKAEDVYTAFTKPIYTENKNKTDIREFREHIYKDIIDSVEYGQSPFTKKMLKS